MSADEFADCTCGERIYRAANGGWYHWKADGMPTPACTTAPSATPAAEALAVLRVNWDALRMLMTQEVTMYKQIAADFSEEDMPYARQRCDSMAEHAQRVLDAMDQLEKSARSVTA